MVCVYLGSTKTRLSVEVTANLYQQHVFDIFDCDRRWSIAAGRWPQLHSWQAAFCVIKKLCNSYLHSFEDLRGRRHYCIFLM